MTEGLRWALINLGHGKQKHLLSVYAKMDGCVLFFATSFLLSIRLSVSCKYFESGRVCCAISQHFILEPVEVCLPKSTGI